MNERPNIKKGDVLKLKENHPFPFIETHAQVTRLVKNQECSSGYRVYCLIDGKKNRLCLAWFKGYEHLRKAKPSTNP